MTHRNRKKNSGLRPWIIVIAVAALAIIAAYVLRPDGPDSERDNTIRTAGDARKAVSTGAEALSARDLQRVILPGDLSDIKKDYHGFTLSFNSDNHTPNYVAWELLQSETDGPHNRDGRNFWQDADVPGCPTTKDYTNSGYDRGHIIPAADQKWHPDAMRDCFTMTNITPQDHALNAGAWATLEEKERVWARRDSALIIVAGPIYNNSDRRRIGEAGVRVPSAFFKVLLAPYLDKPRAIGFIYPNMQAPGNMADYAMSVDEVEKITGFDFFSALPDDIEQDIESNYSFKTWNRR